MDDADQQDLYIFGYGSIIWKNSEIPHTFSTSAFVRGYSRRFWHGSPDHRGTVDAPGRVVSLYTTADMEETGVKDRDIVQENTSDYNEPRVHGIAFLVTDEHRRKVLASLEQRESGGYEPLWLPIFVYENRQNGDFRLIAKKALTYVAPISSEWFLGFATHKEIALHVVKCAGESGPNRDYIINLHNILSTLGHIDGHVLGIRNELIKLSS